jgi:cysteine desulfurase
LIYLDNAATTAVHPDVLKAMEGYLANAYGNPSSLHGLGRQARAGLDTARKQLADFLHCRTDELIFTSGGTESIHAGLVGAMLKNPYGGHLVTTAVEHHAVLHTCEFLRDLGIEVTYVTPNRHGVISVESVCAAMRQDTAVVSVMAVNNELGAQNPVCEIATAVKSVAPHVVFHSDMVQALGTVPIQLSHSNVDLASFSGHKIHGPKGIGALYVRKGVQWRPVLHGGSQEMGKRAGTENVPGAVGFGAAVTRLADGWQMHVEHLHAVYNAFWKVLKDTPGVHRNSPDDGVPSILNVSFEGVRNDTLLMRLDLDGIAASAGSACTAGSLEPSHVLEACGLSTDVIGGSLRFSFSGDTGLDDAVRAAERVRDIVESLRLPK